MRTKRLRITVILFLFFCISLPVLCFGQESLPDEIKNIPPLNLNVVKGVKRLKLSSFPNPFNGTVIPWETGYLFIFRHGLSGVARGGIGAALLDNKGEVLREEGFLTLPFTALLQDPRVFSWKGSLYMLYSDIDLEKGGKYFPRIAELSRKNLQCLRSSILTSGALVHHKNWIPVIPKKEKSSSIVLITSLFPFRTAVCDLKELKLKTSESELFYDSLGCPAFWKWGGIGGGTPAHELPDGRFLTFFHSQFKSSRMKRMYVLGAMILDKAYPHFPVACSPRPIIWKKMYTCRGKDGYVGPLFNPGWGKQLERVIFPCGLFLQKEPSSGRLKAFLTCGENDLATVFVTFDVEKLLETLQPLE